MLKMQFKPDPRQIFRSMAIALMLCAIAVLSCSKSKNENSLPSTPQNPLIEERLAKDEAFKLEKDSPIPEQDRPGFRGLEYYPPNADLRFSVKLHRYPAPRQVRLGTNTGEIRRGLRYGYFDFHVKDQSCRLHIYRLEDESASRATLFMPFRDATSGQETYGAGRYIDLKENTTGLYDLDFNRAYNPYCAYNSQYSCPIPPAENTLKIPIRAGEKKYVSAQDH